MSTPVPFDASHTGQHRMKVLLCCYACEPDSGSEQGLGWNVASRIARYHDVHVLVEEDKFRGPIEAFSAAHPEQVRGMTFHYIPRLRLRRLRRIFPPSYYWTYRLWHRKAFALAEKLHKIEHFDIAHQVTLAGYREPGYLCRLGIPFVWGPVGGLNNTPWCLLPLLGIRGALYYGVRNVINSWQKRWGRAAREVAPIAGIVMTSTEEGAQDVRRLWGCDAFPIGEIGCESINEGREVMHRSVSEPLKIAWVGTLTARKALPILLKALQMFKYRAELHVVGDGELRRCWEREALSLPQRHRVLFHGKIPHEKVTSVMAECHVQCITSVRDDTSTVTLEALNAGLPIITLNHCGFATVVDESCGIKIPITNRKQIIADFAAALNRLAEDEDYRVSLCHGALLRCKSFTWDEKIRLICETYEKSLMRLSE